MLYEYVYVSRGAGLECPPRARHRAQPTAHAVRVCQSWALHRQGDNIPILNQSTTHSSSTRTSKPSPHKHQLHSQVPGDSQVLVLVRCLTVAKRS